MLLDEKIVLPVVWPGWCNLKSKHCQSHFLTVCKGNCFCRNTLYRTFDTNSFYWFLKLAFQIKVCHGVKIMHKASNGWKDYQSRVEKRSLLMCYVDRLDSLPQPFPLDQVYNPLPESDWSESKEFQVFLCCPRYFSCFIVSLKNERWSQEWGKKVGQKFAKVKQTNKQKKKEWRILLWSFLKLIRKLVWHLQLFLCRLNKLFTYHE